MDVTENCQLLTVGQSTHFAQYIGASRALDVVRIIKKT